MGITALEMAEGEPPLMKEPPLKRLLITIQGPPGLQAPDRWSSSFQHFLSRSFDTNPAKRASSEQLLMVSVKLHIGVSRIQSSDLLALNFWCLLCENISRKVVSVLTLR